MKIRLENKDLLQFSKAIKGGCIDTDKVACLKKIVDNYRPPEYIEDDELKIYLKSLLIGWRLVPATMSDWESLVLNEWADDEVKEKIIAVGIDLFYRRLVKRVIIGMLSLSSLGYSFDLSDFPNTDKMGKMLSEYLKIKSDLW